MIEIPRRRFIAGLAGIIAAPAVVRASSLMRVKPVPAHRVIHNPRRWGKAMTLSEYSIPDAHKSLIDTFMRPNEFLQMMMNDAATYGTGASVVSGDGSVRVIEPADLYV